MLEKAPWFLSHRYAPHHPFVVDLGQFTLRGFLFFAFRYHDWRYSLDLVFARPTVSTGEFPLSDVASQSPSPSPSPRPGPTFRSPATPR